jgi:hypothetical protein
MKAEESIAATKQYLKREIYLNLIFKKYSYFCLIMITKKYTNSWWWRSEIQRRDVTV